MPGESNVCRERPPRKIYTAIFKLLENVPAFCGETLFELVDELSDSLFYFLSNPTMDKRCKKIGVEQYKEEVLNSLKQFQLVEKALYQRLKYGGSNISAFYHESAQLMNARESVEILGIVRRMKDPRANDIFTRTGSIMLSEDNVKLKKKVISIQHQLSSTLLI